MPFATHRAQQEGGPFLSAPSPFEYPPDLLPQLQDALAHLADIEFLYEARMDRAVGLASGRNFTSEMHEALS